MHSMKQSILAWAAILMTMVGLVAAPLPWAISLVNAIPLGGKKTGADSGIDGLIDFKPAGKTTEKAIGSVKGGDNVNIAMVRDLAHVVDRKNAGIGIFVTLADSTGPLRTEAVKAGYYETIYGKYQKIRRQAAEYSAH